MENIDIEKLVSDIKTGEQAYRSGQWKSWCESRGLGRKWSDSFWPTPYADHMTGLYTLRAFLRGRMHRRNPPAQVRDFNRSMLHNDTPGWQMSWSMEEHNRKIAEGVAASYQKEAAA